MPAGPATGLEIKEAAIKEGVNIQPNFVLQVQLPNGSSKVVGRRRQDSIDRAPRLHRDCRRRQQLGTHREARCRERDRGVEARISRPRRCPAARTETAGRTLWSRRLSIGERYRPSSTWLGGHIPALYPYTDIYPLFMGDNVRRADGVAFEAPITHGARFFERPALQISRRNNHTQHYPQTAVAKFLKVLHFMGELP